MLKEIEKCIKESEIFCHTLKLFYQIIYTV